MTDERDTGLIKKYEVKRLDDATGKHEHCRFFVLDPQHDPMARDALRAYAHAAIDAGYQSLADDLARWLDSLSVDA